MNWIIGGIIGTSVAVLMISVIKILSMKSEIERLNTQMKHVIADRNHFGYYDSDLKRVELWSEGKEAIWKAVEERFAHKLMIGRRYIPHAGWTKGYPVNKVLERLLAKNGLEVVDVVTDGFELRKASQ